MTRAAFALAYLAVALTGPSAYAQGSVRSQVIWSDKVIPKNEPVLVNPRRGWPLAGRVLKDELIIDAKTKGVKNVVFWLADAKEPSKLIATPKRLQNQVVEIDSPVGHYVPRHAIILAGQDLVLKNTSRVAHGIVISGGVEEPNLNLAQPPGNRVMVGKVKTRLFPIIPFSSPIHPWMRGYILPLPSPYYGITDAEGRFEIKDVPAGEYRLVGWHEKIGWIFPGKDLATRNTAVTVKDKAATELKPLPRKVEDED